MKLENELKALTKKARELLKYFDRGIELKDWQQIANDLEDAIGAADRALEDATESERDWDQLNAQLRVALNRSAAKDKTMAALKIEIVSITAEKERGRELLAEWLASSSKIAFDSPEWHRLNDLTDQLLGRQFMRRLSREEVAELPRDGWIGKGVSKWSFDRAWSVDKEWFYRMTRAGMIGLEVTWNDLYVVCNA